MEKVLASLGLKYLASKMDGKKTYFGAAVLILIGLGKMGVGLVMLLCIMYPDLSPPEVTGPIDIDSAWTSLQAGGATFAAGFAALGIGHKIEKSSGN